MNKGQRIATAIGILLVALSGIVPPYEGVMVREGDNLKADMGYHCIFAPPSPKAVATALGMDDIEDYYLKLFSAKLATDRVLIQILTITIVAAGVAALFSKKREP